MYLLQMQTRARSYCETAHKLRRAARAKHRRRRQQTSGSRIQLIYLVDLCSRRECTYYKGKLGPAHTCETAHTLRRAVRGSHQTRRPRPSGSRIQRPASPRAAALLMPTTARRPKPQARHIQSRATPYTGGKGNVRTPRWKYVFTYEQGLVSL